jgi:hypothetical protein
MNVFTLSGHSWLCKCNENTDENDNKYTTSWFGEIRNMECNISHFIFFLSGEFYMLNYYECHNKINETDFRKDILHKICDKLKEKKNIWSNIETGNRLNTRLMSEIKKGHITKMYALEVVYTYGYTGEFCITNKIPVSDMVRYNVSLKEKFIIAKKYIDDMYADTWNHSHFMDLISFYYEKNYIFLSNTEVVKTVDQLIKQINQKTNERVKIS